MVSSTSDVKVVKVPIDSTFPTSPQDGPLMETLSLSPTSSMLLVHISSEQESLTKPVMSSKVILDSSSTVSMSLFNLQTEILTTPSNMQVLLEDSSPQAMLDSPLEVPPEVDHLLEEPQDLDHPLEDPPQPPQLLPSTKTTPDYQLDQAHQSQPVEDTQLPHPQAVTPQPPTSSPLLLPLPKLPTTQLEMLSPSPLMMSRETLLSIDNSMPTRPLLT